MNTIDALQWRYATKKFDTDREVSEEDLMKILEAGNMAATSYGLQPFSFVVVSDKDTKSQLLQHAYNQEQITSCSHLIVLAAETNLNDEYVDEYTSRLESQRGLDAGALSGYGDIMKSDMANRSEEDKVVWGMKQAYIALGSMMIQAGEMQIDGCPMEGFNNEKFDEILGLADHNLASAVIFPVGYRSEEDQTQHYKKVRKGLDQVVVRK